MRSGAGMTWKKHLAAAPIAFAIAACVPAGNTPPSPAAEEPAPELEIAEPPAQPRGIAIPITRPTDDVLSEEESALSAAPTRLTLFFNRNGGTYSPGNDDAGSNRSSIIGSRVSVPAYEKSEASWQAFMTCIRAQFARFDVNITDVDPGPGVQHIENVVGGSPGNIGFGNGIGGVSPMDPPSCSVIRGAVVYTFSRQYRNAQAECETSAQEVGHALGMDHEYLCEDPMTYLGGCGNKSFQDTNARCGEYSPRTCSCSRNRSNQNSVQHLLSVLGPARTGTSAPPPPPTTPPPTPSDTTAPMIELVAPADGATLPGNQRLTVRARATDDVGVTKVELRWQYNGLVYRPDRTQGDTYEWDLNVGTGGRTFYAVAVDAAGNSSRTTDRSITLSGGGGGGGGGGGDRTPPTGSVVQPSNPYYRVGDSGKIQVRATDDTDVSSVRMVWGWPGGSLTYSLEQTGTDTWEYPYNLRQTGTRTIDITITDTSGNRTTIPRVSFEVLAQGAALPDGGVSTPPPPPPAPDAGVAPPPPPPPVDAGVAPPPPAPDAGMTMTPPGSMPGDGVRFITYANQKTRSDPAWGTQLTDIEQHLPASYGSTYYDSDRVTHGHETTHGIHSHLRNNFNMTGRRANGFYVLQDRAIIIPEPNIRKSQVGPFIPQSLRASRYGTYITGQTAWDDTPLYVWDEWNAYVNGSEVGVGLARAGMWRYGSRDAVTGTLEFTIYAIAVAMAVERHDPNYLTANPQFREFLAWNARRAMQLYREGAQVPDFQRADQEAYYARIKTSADAADLRAFARRFFSDAWAVEVLGL